MESLGSAKFKEGLIPDAQRKKKRVRYARIVNQRFGVADVSKPLVKSIGCKRSAVRGSLGRQSSYAGLAGQKDLTLAI